MILAVFILPALIYGVSTLHGFTASAECTRARQR
jgi:hypothetical protein